MLLCQQGNIHRNGQSTLIVCSINQRTYRKRLPFQKTHLEPTDVSCFSFQICSGSYLIDLAWTIYFLSFLYKRLFCYLNFEKVKGKNVFIWSHIKKLILIFLCLWLCNLCDITQVTYLHITIFLLNKGH